MEDSFYESNFDGLLQMNSSFLCECKWESDCAVSTIVVQ